MIKNIGYAAIFLVLGAILTWLFIPKFNWFEKKEKTSATVVLEQIKEVTKLITIEGNFSELYTYEDYYSYNISPLRKKAIVRVTGKVSVGYDFEKMQVSVNPATNTVTIRNFPPPEILSTDHDLDYYDITEGVFNSFSKDDFNKINRESKDKLLQSAKTKELLVQAESRKHNLIDLLRGLLESNGYQLEIMSMPMQDLN